MAFLRNSLLVLAGIALSAGTAGASTLESGREAFLIELPSGCRLDVQSPVEDFEVFTATCSQQAYARVYVGNAPDRSIRGRLLRTRYSWPTYVQAWSLSVPHDQARADRIAHSVKLKRR